MQTLQRVTDIIEIVGQEHAEDWVQLHPKIFYKEDKPYGLVGLGSADDKVLVASTTSDPSLPFSIGMLKYVLTLNKSFNISWITDVPQYAEAVRGVLSKHGFTFEYDEDNTMYSNRKRST